MTTDIETALTRLFEDALREADGLPAVDAEALEEWRADYWRREVARRRDEGRCIDCGLLASEQRRMVVVDDRNGSLRCWECSTRQWLVRQRQPRVGGAA